MIKVITYGTYDMLHQGHLNLLRRAKELGDYLIVGVTSDSFDRGRGKLNVRNNVLERVEAVRATGYADEVIIEDYMETKDNLMGFLTSYVKDHPEVDINIIIPNEGNIKKVLEAIK